MYKKIDYASDSLEEIKVSELEKARLLLKQLEDSDRLCSSEGRIIVHEFGFKGNKEKVEQQLRSWIRIIDKFGFCEGDRKELQEKYDRYISFVLSEKEDPYKTSCLDAIRKGNLSEVIHVADMGVSRKKELHNKKECICYNN